MAIICHFQLQDHLPERIGKQSSRRTIETQRLHSGQETDIARNFNYSRKRRYNAQHTQISGNISSSRSTLERPLPGTPGIQDVQIVSTQQDQARVRHQHKLIKPELTASHGGGCAVLESWNYLTEAAQRFPTKHGLVCSSTTAAPPGKWRKGNIERIKELFILPFPSPAKRTGNRKRSADGMISGHKKKRVKT